MRELRYLIILGLCVSFGLSAPVPKHRSKPVPKIVSGAYLFRWGGTNTTAKLYYSNTHEYDWLGTQYRGTWHWDDKTRTLHISETSRGEFWDNWSVALDENLKGVCKWRNDRVEVEFKMIKGDAK